jgi:hypothetical protein
MFSRQVCFRKVKNSNFDDDIDDSGDDENVISVNDLLAQAAKDPDSNENTSDVDEELGSPLSAGSALAPANASYRNTLLCVFHDTAQAARDRSSAQEDEPDDHPTSSAGINSNGKRPYQLLVHDKENLQHPLLPVPVPNKKPRGGGRTRAGRGGHHKK